MGGGSAVTIGDILDYVLCFLVKKSMQHLSEKTQFSGFLFPQVVQKHQLGEVGK